MLEAAPGSSGSNRAIHRAREDEDANGVRAGARWGIRRDPGQASEEEKEPSAGASVGAVPEELSASPCRWYTAPRSSPHCSGGAFGSAIDSVSTTIVLDPL